jgi:hypothetical protein
LIWTLNLRLSQINKYKQMWNLNLTLSQTNSSCANAQVALLVILEHEFYRLKLNSSYCCNINNLSIEVHCLKMLNVRLAKSSFSTLLQAVCKIMSLGYIAELVHFELIILFWHEWAAWFLKFANKIDTVKTWTLKVFSLHAHLPELMKYLLPTPKIN